MKEDYAPIGDMITLVANQQQGEATVIVNDLLSNRVLGALQTQKQEIAKNLFAPGGSPLSEEIVQEEHESVEDFLKRGGKVKQVPAGKAHGSQKKQTIKVPFRMGKAAR